MLREIEKALLESSDRLQTFKEIFELDKSTVYLEVVNCKLRQYIFDETEPMSEEEAYWLKINQFIANIIYTGVYPNFFGETLLEMLEPSRVSDKRRIHLTEEFVNLLKNVNKYTDEYKQQNIIYNNNGKLVITETASMVDLLLGEEILINPSISVETLLQIVNIQLQQEGLKTNKNLIMKKIALNDVVEKGIHRENDVFVLRCVIPEILSARPNIAIEVSEVKINTPVSKDTVIPVYTYKEV